jgi:hypothetical protein
MWLQTGSLSLTATNASSGVFLPTGSTWLQAGDANMTLDSTQGTAAIHHKALVPSDAACTNRPLPLSL